MFPVKYITIFVLEIQSQSDVSKLQSILMSGELGQPYEEALVLVNSGYFSECHWSVS